VTAGAAGAAPAAVAVPTATLLAAALDRAVAEPPTRLHPVAWFGSLVAPVDRAWARPRLVGGGAALVLPLVAAGVAAGIVALAGSSAAVLVGDGAGRDVPALAAATLAAGAALFVCTSLRLLVATAGEVAALAGEDLPTARDRLRALAGRDASDLPAAGVRSAAVESAAENLADGLVAPLSAFVGGAVAAALAGGSPVAVLAVAAAGAAWIKAVNTLDSMLGYRSKPVGWASARLDDAVMWLPARLSAGLLALAAAEPGALAAARRDARVPASPNSGWPMATLAAALDARLEKPGAYVLNADAAAPTPADAARGVALVARAGRLGIGLAAAAGALGVAAGSRLAGVGLA